MSGISPIGVLGTGSLAPEKIVTNFDLEKLIDTNDEWISSRTGIRARRMAGPETATSDLAIGAAKAALQNAGVEPGEIDLVIVATCTPDHPMPATAVLVHRALGLKRCAAFDLNAACSGFAYALDVGWQMLKGGAHRKALVIGADIMTRAVNWKDRSTCVLFGDGAGAVVLGDVESGGILSGALGADGAGAPLLMIPAGGSREPSNAENIAEGRTGMVMNGREVYKFAVQIMGEAAVQALAKCDLTPDDVSLFIPHQANIRIIESAGKRLGLSPEKIFVNIDQYGNTSAGSVPLALDEAYRKGRIHKGDIVVTVGFGAGLTWAANVIRWSI
jgi:3-oxoacyl-[acyl-carrier-protein] synthase-3